MQNALCKILTDKGVCCKSVENIHGMNEKSFEDFNRIILPFPSRSDKIRFLSKGEKLSDYLTEKQTVTGGMFSEDIIQDLEEHGIGYNDYFTSEAYVLKNAFITSQGVLRLLLENAKAFLPGKKVLITGFGRIGRSLALMLKSLGMKVFVAARSESALCEAQALGFEVFRLSVVTGTLFYYDFIINTVPSDIFTKKDISHIRSDTVYFEVASSPYGAERSLFEAENKPYIDAGALPGKLYPDAVAVNIADYILNSGK